ncbi:MAG: OmpA family protein [Candidatus Eisenbacteria bacterium]|uniref:OmpA family protein n=1 Tax=Eiseniibacteriota bacterium TaxID=2212470 RepID=A0A849SZR7_UNCEI|nr:OmpA family protein [Candidatus Eisenbacteria bacterium]
MRRRLWWSLVLVSLFAAPVHAQVAGTPWEFSGFAGIFSPDARARVETGPAAGFTLGYRWQSWFVTEGYALYAPSSADTFPGGDATFMTGGIALRFNLRPAEQRVVPFIQAGVGYAQSSLDGAIPKDLERGAPQLGMGALFSLFGSPRTSLRLEVRDVMFRDRDSKEFSNHVGAYAGIQFTLGGKNKDIDLDGVRDWLDQCPATPIGAKVDARGCPTDGDGDGVFDGIDKCDGTPKGATVDKNGCPSDADGDGVFDGLDTCAETPKGATVDAKGCPSDADSDKVFDGLDQCPNTPTGATVDDKGCPSDSDGDGVFDGLDQCEATPAGLRVDDKGCPIELVERETELLDTGTIRLQNVNFETAKSDILAESFPTLDAVAALMVKWPQLKIEIGGHTDGRGSATANQQLSLSRAKAVETYLLGKQPTLKDEQFTVKGYGESKPLAPNDGEVNWAKNRRVEFVVLNKDVLKKEVERRRLLEKPAAPADSTQKN